GLILKEKWPDCNRDRSRRLGVHGLITKSCRAWFIRSPGSAWNHSTPRSEDVQTEPEGHRRSPACGSYINQWLAGIAGPAKKEAAPDDLAPPFSSASAVRY